MIVQDLVDRSVFICFSHLRWNFVFQRPQHILTRAAKEYQVYFIEEPCIAPWIDEPEVVQDAPMAALTVVTPMAPAGCSAQEVLDLQRGALDAILTRHRGTPTVFWYYAPQALLFSDHLTADLTVYDCMDELSAFRGAAPELRSLEAKLLDRADLVFTGGRSLYEAKRRLHPAVHAFPSSVDVRHFAAARTGALDDPPDQAELPHPRVGFFGVVDERMDMDLVAAVAERRPDVAFVMLGPVAKIDAAEMPSAANIHWLGGKSYDALPAYLAHWDAGFMPFARNEATRFISPTKTPEFLAAGLPVVSTPIRDVVSPYGERGLVSIAASTDDMVAAIDRILADPPGSGRAAADAFLADLSWDRTWAGMRRLMENALRGPTAQRPRDAALPRTGSSPACMTGS